MRYDRELDAIVDAFGRVVCRFNRDAGFQYCEAEQIVNAVNNIDYVIALEKIADADADALEKTTSQLTHTQAALKGLYNAIRRSQSVNDPLGMTAAMDEAGRWF